MGSSDNSGFELTAQQKRLLDTSDEIHASDRQELGFVFRTMTAASMPHSKVKGIQYTRKTNKFTLTITGTDQTPIPYGTYPRLILSWIASEAVKTNSREIFLGNSLSNFMNKIGISVTGGEFGTVSRFKNQLKSLFSAVISFQYEDNGEWFKSNMSIAEKAHLFWEPQSAQDIALFKSSVILGEAFFAEVMKAPVPVDLRAISVLKGSSLALDIYFWITYRLNYMDKPASIPFEKLQLQFGAGYKDTPHDRYEFKRKFLIQLKNVLCLYPHAKIVVQENGLLISPSISHIRKNLRKR